MTIKLITLDIAGEDIEVSLRDAEKAYDLNITPIYCAWSYKPASDWLSPVFNSGEIKPSSWDNITVTKATN